MSASPKLSMAFQLFDEANSEDPNTEIYKGEEFPKELLYAIRMTDTLSRFAPDASETLQLAARCQHICRWKIPRDAYEMNRVGYLRWREELKKFHVQKASEILAMVGYGHDVIQEVQLLLLKKQLRKNIDSQTLEDVVCLVFLQYYFEQFANKHSEEKVVEILQKTWGKMSADGQKAAVGLPISKKVAVLVKKAIS
ncbi:DUF4202 domain-containing protein [Flagellimonas sp.]|uniref:DUF4202 domain-containing protein n=1 Tax=Flagellimonas sp. TaxID=2058762 RepID=UPI003B50060B